MRMNQNSFINQYNSENVHHDVIISSQVQKNVDFLLAFKKLEA
jgi:hypothetical protein